jgi:hypothetical protein
MVPEDLLSEPVDDGAMEACVDVPDAGLRSSRASSTLEHDLEGREADLDCPGPMEVAEGPSTLEVVTMESLDLKNGAYTCPAPEDVAGDDLARVKSVSHCPAPEGAAGDDPAQVGSAPADRVLGSVEGTELISAGSLQAASGGGLTPSYQLISSDLGIPSFFSNLQVS